MWRDKKLIPQSLPHPTMPSSELGVQGASDWICQSADFSFPAKTAGEAKNAREIGIQPLYTYMYTAAGWLIVEKD